MATTSMKQSFAQHPFYRRHRLAPPSKLQLQNQMTFCCQKCVETRQNHKSFERILCIDFYLKGLCKQKPAVRPQQSLWDELDLSDSEDICPSYNNVDQDQDSPPNRGFAVRTNLKKNKRKTSSPIYPKKTKQVKKTYLLAFPCLNFKQKLLQDYRIVQVY